MNRRLLTHAIALMGLLSLSSGSDAPPEVQPAPGGEGRAAEIQRVVDFLHARPSGLSDAEIAAASEAVVDEAHSVDLDTELVLAVIEVESSGSAFAVSQAGAIGLMQLRPRTGAAVAREIGIEWRGARTLEDPVANVRLGIRYLARLIGRFGDLQTALAAYNRGPTRVASELRGETGVPASYPRRVMAAWDARRAPDPI